jgi:hypothetical protein
MQTTVLDVIDFTTGEQATTTDPFLIKILERGSAAQLEADAAYLPLSTFLDADAGRNYNALRRILRQNPDIRTRRPRSKKTGETIRNRLEVHVGDWVRCVGAVHEVTRDPLDRPAAEVDAMVAEVEQRKTEQRRRRAGD